MVVNIPYMEHMGTYKLVIFRVYLNPPEGTSQMSQLTDWWNAVL